MKDFESDLEGVWRMRSGGAKRLTKEAIKEMYYDNSINQEKSKLELIISLDDCTVDKDAFSNCPYSGIIIASGDNIEELYFNNTGITLKSISVGKLSCNDNDVPRKWGSNFSKLKKITFSNCPVLRKFAIKSNLQQKVEVIQENCPKLGIKKDNKAPKVKEDSNDNLLELGFVIDGKLAMDDNGVWKNISDNKLKLTSATIAKMWIDQMYSKNKAQKSDKLLISLDNCTVDKQTFSNCDFRSITIVSGKDIEKLHFIKAGNLERVGIGKIADTNKNVPNDWKGTFPKLKKITLFLCPKLRKFVIKSDLQKKVELVQAECPNLKGDIEIKK